MPTRPFFGFSPAAHQGRSEAVEEEVLGLHSLFPFILKRLRLQGQKNHQEMDPFYYTSKNHIKKRENPTLRISKFFSRFSCFFDLLIAHFAKKNLVKTKWFCTTFFSRENRRKLFGWKIAQKCNWQRCTLPVATN